MDRFNEFDVRLCDYAAGILTDEDFRPQLALDAFVDPRLLDIGLLDEWEQLEPFGEANPPPSLASRDMLCSGVRRIGKDQTHLKVTIEHGAGPDKWSADCVAWGKAQDWEQTMGCRDPIEIAYLPTITTFNGRRSLQLVIKDIRPIAE